MKEYILKKSQNMGKRYVIIMGDTMKHHFGSAGGKTYIDGRSDVEKAAWIARHKGDKNYNNKHSGIYWSRWLLWSKKTLDESIKDMEKRLGVKIKLI